MLTASNKVKYISCMTTSLRFKCCAKSFNNTPASIPTKIIVMDFDSFMPGDSNILCKKGVARKKGVH